MPRASTTVNTARSIVRLRHTARRHADVRDEVAPVIADLREDLEPTLTKRAAADIIGISLPTLNKWVARGLLPVERTRGGRPRLLRDAVLELAERIDDLRQMGENTHLVAAAVERLQREDPDYQRQFEELYGPGLAATVKGDFLSAAPGPDWDPED